MSFVFAAAVSLCLAVVLGAFGAHALRDSLEASGRTAAWETAVLYQAVHGLALLAVGVWQAVDARARTDRSLFLLGLGAPRWIGPVTPVGGLGFIAGWIALAASALRHSRSAGRK